MRRRLDYKLIISIDLFNYKEDIKDNELHYVTLTSVIVMLYSGAKTYRNIFFSFYSLFVKQQSSCIVPARTTVCSPPQDT